ncbi:hypothetical protein BRD56_05025 [Thermoplasmatales archaeon SW_10_69_26]|nr:MAG: hypothetical protein BRD56_05025 [Thermoplasmatales archaeon SW_10_69_26]
MPRACRTTPEHARGHLAPRGPSPVGRGIVPGARDRAQPDPRPASHLRHAPVLPLLLGVDGERGGRALRPVHAVPARAGPLGRTLGDRWPRGRRHQPRRGGAERRARAGRADPAGPARALAGARGDGDLPRWGRLPGGIGPAVGGLLADLAEPGDARAQPRVRAGHARRDAGRVGRCDVRRGPDPVGRVGHPAGSSLLRPLPHATRPQPCVDRRRGRLRGYAAHDAFDADDADRAGLGSAHADAALARSAAAASRRDRRGPALGRGHRRRPRQTARGPGAVHVPGVRQPRTDPGASAAKGELSQLRGERGAAGDGGIGDDQGTREREGTTKAPETADGNKRGSRWDGEFPHRSRIGAKDASSAGSSTTDAESPGPLPEAVEETASDCLEAAFRVQSDLGSGLLEKVYRDALAVELRHRGLDVGTEVTVPVSYRDQALGVGLRLDILVADCVVIEVESVDAFASAHTAQTLTYLEATGKRLGFLLGAERGLSIGLRAANGP